MSMSNRNSQSSFVSGDSLSVECVPNKKRSYQPMWWIWTGTSNQEYGQAIIDFLFYKALPWFRRVMHLFFFCSDAGTWSPSKKNNTESRSQCCSRFKSDEQKGRRLLLQTHIATFCHRITHNFAQDAFFNKCHHRNMSCCRISVDCFHRKEACKISRVTPQGSNFAELDHLVRMNSQIRITARGPQ